MDHQKVSIDQTAPDQTLCELAASEHHDVVAGLLLQRRYRVDRVALEESGVDPWERLRERPRRDELLSLVQDLGERVVRLLRPVAGEVLVSPAAEEDPCGSHHALPDDAAHDLVVVGNCPAAMLEPAADVLVGSARRLHDPIERQARVDGDVAHPDSFRVVSPALAGFHPLHERQSPIRQPQRQRVACHASRGRVGLRSTSRMDSRDWLSTTWTALLAAYAAVALPLLGGALVHAL